MLVDDDPDNLSRGQCARMGAGFSCFGTDIHDLREILPLLDNSPQHSSEPESHSP
jgi:hypothetical protein